MPSVTSTARCLRCGYRLAGLQDARCPECGSPFDPLQRERRSDWKRRVGWGACSALAVTIAFIAPLLYVLERHDLRSPEMLWAVARVSFAVLTGWQIGIIIAALLAALLAARWRCLVLFAMAAALAVSWPVAQSIDALLSTTGTQCGSLLPAATWPPHRAFWPPSTGRLAPGIMRTPVRPAADG